MDGAPPDPVAVIETFYRQGTRDPEWLGKVAAKLLPLLDFQQMGIVGILYHCPDPSQFTPSHILLCDVPKEMERAIFASVSSFTPEYIAESFLNRGCCLGSSVRGWNAISAVQAGIMVEGIQLNVIEPDGYGCYFFSGMRAPVRGASMSDDWYLMLTRLQRHLAASHRLRRRHANLEGSPTDADAVLDPGGCVRHAEDIAKEPASRAAERWTLAEHFESDGKRFVLAMDNRPALPSLELLSERESEVVLRALSGQDNKAIAHGLALAPSTVRVLLARAASKLKVGSRRELLAKARALGLATPAAESPVARRMAGDAKLRAKS
jgi:DNA-binding CsgD family transcriptional regulator